MPTIVLNKKKDVVSIATRRCRIKVINDVARELISGKINNISKYYHVYPWLTRHMVNGCIRRNKKRCNDSSNTTILGNTITITNKNGGRPIGSTAISKLDLEKYFIGKK